VNAVLYNPTNTIIAALGLKNPLHAMLDAPIMDTAADIMIRTRANKINIGSMEGEKLPRGQKDLHDIFGSGTAVADEAFEQLCLCEIQ